MSVVIVSDIAEHTDFKLSKNLKLAFMSFSVVDQKSVKALRDSINDWEILWDHRVDLMQYDPETKTFLVAVKTESGKDLRLAKSISDFIRMLSRGEITKMLRLVKQDVS